MKKKFEPVIFRLRCSRGLHTIMVTHGGKMKLMDHDLFEQDPAGMKVLKQLDVEDTDSLKDTACFVLLNDWERFLKYGSWSRKNWPGALRRMFEDIRLCKYRRHKRTYITWEEYPKSVVRAIRVKTEEALWACVWWRSPEWKLCAVALSGCFEWNV